MAFGSGFRDLLSNLQKTSAARSCFADLSASWIYLGLVSWVSTRILCVVPRQLFSSYSECIAKVKNNLLGEALLCLALGSGCCNPRSNLQTPAAAWSCFVDLPAFSLCLRFRLGVFGIARAFRALYLSNCFQVNADALQK